MDVDDAIVVAVVVGVSLRSVGVSIPRVAVGDGMLCGRVGAICVGALAGG